MIDTAFVPNPAYGAGIFRRRIRLLSTHGRVHAALEDNYHAMECEIDHDGQIVTVVNARMHRVPMTTCAGATEPIRTLIGEPLTTELLPLYRRHSPQRNCTHLFDLACLALLQAARGDGVRQYDVEIPDEGAIHLCARAGEIRNDSCRESDATAAKVSVSCDGTVVHAWQTLRGKIVAPEELADRPMVAGFLRWAIGAFSGDMLEAAFVLHRGYFVSNARRSITDDAWLLAPSQQPTMQGVCHTYQAENVGRAVRLRNVARDFTDRPANLLSWLESSDRA